MTVVLRSRHARITVAQEVHTRQSQVAGGAAQLGLAQAGDVGMPVEQVGGAAPTSPRVAQIRCTSTPWWA